MKKCWFSPLVCLLVFFCLALQSTNGSTDTILQGQTITHPNTIISSAGKFELGFFSPRNSSKYYLGMWHEVFKQAIVWVANRESPFLNASCSLTINSEGQLLISNGKTLYMITTIINYNMSATLLDSGNLVLKDRNSLRILWQSFDYPTDTVLPGMKLGPDNTNGYIWSLVSWTSPEDPGPGSFTLDLSTDGVLVVWQGSKPYWNDSLGEFGNNMIYQRDSKKQYGYFTWGSLDSSGITHMVLDAFGQLMIRSWSDDDRSWYTLKSSKCSIGKCGAFGVCNIMAADNPCSCLRGFKPLSTNGSSEFQTSDDCVRNTNLQCDHSIDDHIQNNGFYQMTLDFPSDQWASYKIFPDWSREYCGSACLKDYSCIAYSFDSKLGCLSWFNDLFDLKQLATNDANGKDFYLKLRVSELNITKDSINKWNQGRPKNYRQQDAAVDNCNTC